MTKLKCRKQYGTWHYTKTMPSIYNDLDAPIYSLYDADQNFVFDFGSYGDMKYFVETGVIL
jgi:hypothetical protein